MITFLDTEKNLSSSYYMPTKTHHKEKRDNQVSDPSRPSTTFFGGPTRKERKEE